MALLFVPSYLPLPRAERVLQQLPSRRPPFHAPSQINREARINGSRRKKVTLAGVWEFVVCNGRYNRHGHWDENEQRCYCPRDATALDVRDASLKG